MSSAEFTKGWAQLLAENPHQSPDPFERYLSKADDLRDIERDMFNRFVTVIGSLDAQQRLPALSLSDYTQFKEDCCYVYFAIKDKNLFFNLKHKPESAL